MKNKHAEYIERLKQSGVKVVDFSCPFCGEAIETQAAPDGETWDTAASCQHCNAIYGKITRGEKAVGVKLNLNIPYKDKLI